MNELYKEYEELMMKISAYELVMGTTYLDAQTTAPDKGAEYRNKRLSFLQGELYSMQTEGRLPELLDELSKADDLTDEQKRIIKWHLKELNLIKCVPKDVVVEQSLLLMESEQAWEKAKRSSNYELFKPYLLKVIEMSKKILSYRPDGYKGYDALLDDYEPGMTIEKYDAFFNKVREGLVPLIRKIAAGKQIDDEFVYQYYPIDKQEILMKKIMEYIDFDFDAGVLMQSEHPFTDSLSKYDTRITTHYYENNLLSSIFSVIHEAGHANYNRQVRDDLSETFVFDNMSSGMHESQSRFYENYLGRNYHFWDKLFPEVKALFPEQLKDIDQEKFVKAVNKAIPSLIRTEADELTYPLHIMIRYEIEKGIFDGTVDLEKLPEIWNQKYHEYLGVEVPDDAHGILQDVHWSDGSFGYFPTYALGSGYGAQFLAAMQKDLDVDKCLSEGKYTVIKDWLRDKIHQYGGLYLPSEQIEMATGEPFNPDYYVNYLVKKYSELYGL
ncbi:MAG: carboxypeptidase M32 [Erysipelotrichaceae bacterium]|nr:carboxypeptidase M32 [Erysipelotrichaceae bacterium]